MQELKEGVSETALPMKNEGVGFLEYIRDLERDCARLDVLEEMLTRGGVWFETEPRLVGAGNFVAYDGGSHLRILGPTLREAADSEIKRRASS